MVLAALQAVGACAVGRGGVCIQQGLTRGEMRTGGLWPRQQRRFHHVRSPSPHNRHRSTPRTGLHTVAGCVPRGSGDPQKMDLGEKEGARTAWQTLCVRAAVNERSHESQPETRPDVLFCGHMQQGSLGPDFVVTQKVLVLQSGRRRIRQRRHANATVSGDKETPRASLEPARTLLATPMAPSSLRRVMNDSTNRGSEPRGDSGEFQLARIQRFRGTCVQTYRS